MYERYVECIHVCAANIGVRVRCAPVKSLPPLLSAWPFFCIPQPHTIYFPLLRSIYIQYYIVGFAVGLFLFDCMHYIIVLAVECRICGIHVYSRDCELLCVSPASRQTNTAIVRTKSERQYCGECERKENSEVWGDGLTCSSRSCVLMPLVVDIFCMHAGLMHDARYMRVCVCVRENVEAAITNEIARVRAAYTWADNMPPNILMFSYVSRCIWFGTFGSAHFAHVCSVCCSVKSLDIVVHPSLHSNIHRYDFVFIFFGILNCVR